MTTNKSFSQEALIVGAGPTGLMMGCQLALRRLPFRIIDKNEDHTTQSRAIVVHARSLEIFGQMDIDEPAINLGQKVKGINIISNGRKAFRLDVNDVGRGITAYPYLLMLEQSKTEKILNDFLLHHGYQVERKKELIKLTQDDDGVTAIIKDENDNEETIRTEWLIGADGANSYVRKELQIPFEGKTYDESLFVLDCELNMDFPFDEMYVIFSQSAFTGIFPLPNRRCRVLGTIQKELPEDPAIAFEEIATDFSERTQLSIRLKNPDWISMYRSHHRAVSAFRKKRCFLAGDAAHIHSPVGAQGMNTGLQDAYNLAWKLALTAQGKAHESLLDTYHEERAGVAFDLVKTTDRAFRYVNSQNPVLKFFRLNLMPFALKFLYPTMKKIRFIRETGFSLIAGIAINYRTSSLSSENPGSLFPWSAPRPGDRVPYVLDNEYLRFRKEITNGAKFHLVIFPSQQIDQHQEKKLSDLVKMYPNAIDLHIVLRHAASERMYKIFGIQKYGYYLVRPDEYICYRSDSWDMEHFFRYLQTWLIS